MNNITEQLFTLRDSAYKSFHSKLMPTVNPDVIIGVRTPVLRKFANEFAKSGNIKAFMNSLPHTYYEENNLHGFLIEKIKNYNECVEELNRFLPYVNNWATCDLMTPKIFKKHTDELLAQIDIWIKSDHTYTVRFAIKMLMSFYLDDNFTIKYADTVAAVKSEEYYVNMMIAWYFATALAKQYKKIVPYIENNILGTWVHNKTIQKAIESYRITDEQKIYLRKLKR